ncbi:hypothetical protein Slin15195_G005080 [Septoria linicola]|uniref:Uncharacterized protein n=1 Tax=Septoria linicola TaxID=215465 RepID=A0A9Q9EER0_9PEZI|nr:hypothetical protein Slin14017_G005120 [Septoria linicola]USW47189.1 hypothetical protein Slin15195_G005080 [Septoria linicola]
MADDLTTTEVRLLETNRRLRAQLDELTTENDSLQLRCEKLQSTLNRLSAQPQKRGRESSRDSYALVIRSDSAGRESAGTPPNAELGEVAASIEARFRDIAEILAGQDRRMSQLESHGSDQPVIDRTAVQSMINQSVKDFEKRLKSVEERPSATSSATNDCGEEYAKERKKILKALDQLRTFMRRIENREKHEREIDMSETRERLHELWEVLGRSENDGQVRRVGPFEGTANDFAVLRDRIICRLAGLSAYDQAFFEAKAAAVKAKRSLAAS